MVMFRIFHAKKSYRKHSLKDRLDYFFFSKKKYAPKTRKIWYYALNVIMDGCRNTKQTDSFLIPLWAARLTNQCKRYDDVWLSQIILFYLFFFIVQPHLRYLTLARG